MSARCSTFAAALAIVAWSSVVRADDGDVERARQHFQRGVTFYKDADYRSALVEFQDAYRAAPNYRVLFNVGQTCKELGDYACAVRSFRDYLARGGAEIERARKSEVEAELQRLEQHVATLDITVNEADATLTAEGDRRIDLGRAPLASPALLNGGRWTLRARKPGFADAEEHVDVSGGNRRSVRLTLLPRAAESVASAPSASAASPATASPRAEGAPSSPRAAIARTPVWIGVGVTGALAVGATVTGVVALGAKSDYDAALGRFGATADDVSRARTKTRTLALATDVLAGAAIVGAIVTVVLFVSSDGSRAGEARARRVVDGLEGRVSF